MMHERAHTHLDNVRINLANHWLEREWSSMLGHTISLLQRADQFEWLHADSPEMRVTCGGETLGALDLGAPDWTEELSPAGATVVARYSGHALNLTLWTMALHNHAALYRGGQLRNNASHPVQLDELCIEIIPLLQSVCDEDRFTPASAPWENPGGGLCIMRPGRCMVAAYERPLEVEITEEQPEACCFRIHVGRELQPGESLELPELLMVFALGTPQAALARAYPDAVKAVEEHRAWRKERMA